MLFHEFAHVDADHRRIVVEQESGECLGELGLADAGRPEEKEAAQRPVRILQACARAADGSRNSLHGIGLPDHAVADHCFHLEELFALAFHHLVDGNARPARDDTGNILRRHFLAQHCTAGGGFGFGKLLFEAGDGAVLKFARLGEIARALRLFQLHPRMIERFLELCLACDLFLFALPAGGQFGGLFLEIGKVFLERLEPVFRGLVGFLLQGLALDLHLDDLAVERLDFLGLGFDFHAEARGGLVHQVDCLVRQETVGNVAVRKGGRRNQRAVRDADAVVQFVFFLEAAQDRDRVLNSRFAHEYRLETALEGRVLFDVLLIFIERGSANAMQLAARKRGLQEIARIHRAFGFARADQRVHLVDEENDMALGAFHFIEHAFQPLLEFASIFGARDQAAHVERHQRPVLQRIRHIAIRDPEREPFGNRCLADAGFADQHGVILGPAGKDLDGAADFLVAADDRIELAFAGGGRQVAREFLQGIVAILGRGRVGSAPAAQLVDRCIECFGLHARFGQGLPGGGRCGKREGQKQPLDSNIAVARFLRDLLGLVEHADKIIVEAGRLLCPASRDGGNLGECRIGFAHRRCGVAASSLDQAGGHALLVLKQSLQKMFGRNALVVHPDRNGLGRLQKSFGAVCEFLEIHSNPLSTSRYGVAIMQHKGVAKIFGLMQDNRARMQLLTAAPGIAIVLAFAVGLG